MVDSGLIPVQDYDYPLTAGHIAQFPLVKRDGSRLLINRNGIISETIFSHIDQFLPQGSLLVFNDTKVIRARLNFRKPTGAPIEIFCLEPLLPVNEIETAFKQVQQCTWKCLVGNLKRWKSGNLQMVAGEPGREITLDAVLNQDLGDGSFAINFNWTPPEKNFSEILETAGSVPLPPYIHRKTVPTDATRYQTIYAAHEGSVAAPTAGLHFTDPVMELLREKGFGFAQITLHVGVGTFRPVSVPDIRDHIMHHERIVISKKTVEQILRHHDRPLIAIGTTAARALESLYWFGVQIIRGENQINPMVRQWEPYRRKNVPLVSTYEALSGLIAFLDRCHLTELHGETQLMIIPGYEFKLIHGMITNFHMPQSTLLLLVAAMIGDDWKKVYHYALQNNFRFLSYGDSCLFFNRSG